MVSVQTSQNIIFTTAEKELTDEDYDRIIPVLQEKVRNFGKVRWYFEMHNFKGWSPSAIWRDLKFDFSNNDKMEKVAMVGDSKWEEGLTQLMKPFAKAEVKFFSLEEEDEAKRWIRKLNCE